MSSCSSDVGGAVANAGLRPRVRGLRETERVLVEERRLLRVADVELEVVPPVDGHEVRVLPHGQSLLGRRHGSRARRGESAIPPAIATPPTICTVVIGSDRRTSAIDRGEERLQVREQRRPRRADPVDRREPEQVGDHERPEHGEREADPDERAEMEALVRELPRPRHEQQQRHGARGTTALSLNGE